MPKEVTLDVLDKILTHLKINKRAFAKSIGISDIDIYNLTNKQNNKILSNEIINKIIEEYPFFNKSYLETGEGYYLKPEYMKSDQVEEALLLTAKAIYLAEENYKTRLEIEKERMEISKIHIESFDRLTKTFEKMVDKFTES